MNTLTVRRPDFEFPQDLSVMPDITDKYYSALTCAVTMIAPHIERYLIRTMKRAKNEISDKLVLQDLNDFCGQEANHFRNHDKLNEILRGKLSGKNQQQLQQIEDDLIEDYRRFSNTKSLSFNLVYAEGFESATCGLSMWAFEINAFEALDPNWCSLIEWHLAEEIEHRTVAFYVYHALKGNYPHRLIFGTYSQMHLLKYLVRFAKCFMAEFEHEGSEKNIIKQQLWPLLRKLLYTLMPWYSPHKIIISKRIDTILAKYS